jgi:hypothetical protein
MKADQALRQFSNSTDLTSDPQRQFCEYCHGGFQLAVHPIQWIRDQAIDPPRRVAE